MLFNPTAFNSRVFNTGEIRLFNRGVFGSPPEFNTGEGYVPVVVPPERPPFIPTPRFDVGGAGGAKASHVDLARKRHLRARRDDADILDLMSLFFGGYDA